MPIINLIEKLGMYLQYPFVVRAIVVGIMIAFCASLLGVTLVLKHVSFIGDGLSHVAFGAMCVAGVLHFSNAMLLVLPITVICAVYLVSEGKHARPRGDSLIALLSVSALALGYLLMSVFPASGNISGDVCSTLFGSTSILTLTKLDVWICVLLSTSVMLSYLLLYHKIFAVTFDESFALATGLHPQKFNLFVSIISAIIIVLAMKLVGSLLITALIIFPALTAMRLFESYRGVILGAAIISVFCAIIGILAAILAGTPVGSTVVATDLFAFLMCSFIRNKRRE